MKGGSKGDLNHCIQLFSTYQNLSPEEILQLLSVCDTPFPPLNKIKHLKKYKIHYILNRYRSTINFQEFTQ